MAVTSYDGLIAQVGADKSMNAFFYADLQTALSGTTCLAASTNQITKHAIPSTFRTLPSPLPGTVTGYMITNAEIMQTGAQCIVLIGRIINLGNINIGTNVFTDGSAMPTVTSLGASYVSASPILCVTTTVLNATPGNLTVTYVDQDGNAAEAAAAAAMTASSSVYAASWLPLNSTDWGARDITAAVQSAGTTPTGVVTFYGFIPLGFCQANASTCTALNLTTGFPSFFKFGAGDQISAVVIGTVSAKGILGKITVVGVE